MNTRRKLEDAMKRKSSQRSYVLCLAIVGLMVVATPLTLIAPLATATGGAVDKSTIRRPVSVRPAQDRNPFLMFSAPVNLIRNPQSAIRNPQSEGPLAPLSLVQADVNDDGRPDLIQGAASAWGGVLRIYNAGYDEMHGLASFSEVGSVTTTVTPELMAAGDCNGDAHQDLIVADRRQNQFVFLAGDGRGQFRARPVLVPGPVQALLVADLPRRDGHDDLVVATSQRQLLIYDRWDFGFTATPQRIVLPADAVAVALDDFNQDHVDDLLITLTDRLVVLYGSLTKRYTLGTGVGARRWTVVPLEGEAMRVVTDDFTGDRRRDLVVQAATGDLRLYSSGGLDTDALGEPDDALPARFSDAVPVGPATAVEPVQVVAGIFDGDRAHDVAVLDRAGRQVVMIRGDHETGAFEPPEAFPIDGQPAALLKARLNADARDDLIVLDGEGAISVLLSLPASAGFSQSEQSTIPHPPSAGFSQLQQSAIRHPPSAMAATAPQQLSTVVTNTGDNGGVNPAPGAGTGTLRQAIVDANASAGAQTIIFNIPASDPNFDDGVFTIRPSSQLPALTNLSGTTVDGQSQIVFTGATNGSHPVIVIDGKDAGGLGFVLHSDSNTIRKVQLINFKGMSADTGAINIAFVDNNQVKSSYIGFLVTTEGTRADIGQSNTNGILIDNGADMNSIGSTNPDDGNVISNNSVAGIALRGPGTFNNQVLGNFIGTDVAGATAQGNARGVLIVGAPSNMIGGTTAGARNVISGNTLEGVLILNSGASMNLVQGNFIGTDVTGIADLGNSDMGVVISGAPTNTIGGMTSSAGNVISGNDGSGVYVILSEATLVQGNFIGTDVTGIVDLGNSDMGVFIVSASNNTIGGTAAGAGNLISGNDSNGVQIQGSEATQVQGNSIGTDVTGTVDLGNTGDGVFIVSASDNTIGGTDAGAGNVISGNDANGVEIINASSTMNQVQGNSIGTQADGLSALGNGGHGVFIDFSASENIIGGTTMADSGNVIAHNGGDGVYVKSGTGNLIDPNVIFNNTGLGIDLDANGTTPNDANDTDTGGNNRQNYPVLTASSSPSGGATTVIGSLNSTANTDFRLEFFVNADCDPSGNGEGETFLGSTMVTTVGNNASFTVVFPVSTLDGQWVTATATDPDGNTSEFSPCVEVIELQPGPTFTVNVADDNDGVCSLRHCSLREAIKAANGLSGTNTIAFNIPGAGPHTITISPNTGLPTITEPVIIDGYTEPGASPNSNPITMGSNAVLMIEVSGSGVGLSNGLHISAGDSTVRGLVINRFHGSGLVLDTTGGNRVEGCFIGPDVTGTLNRGNDFGGVSVDGTSDNTIGGSVPAARNVLSGNGFSGVAIANGATGNQVLGNFIGTDKTGTTAMGNSLVGVVMANSSSNTVGGTSAAARNLISGNGTGVAVNLSGTGNRVLGNSIHDNAGLGIDLGIDGLTDDDPADADAGPNDLQNFPALASASSSGGTTTISGTLHSTFNTTFVLEFFANAACDNPSGHGEGEVFIGSTNVTTFNYNASFTVSFPVTVSVGQWITATATDSNGSTSEFSACVAVTATPCTIACPGNVTQATDPGQCGAIVNYPVPTTTGSCGTVTCTPPTGSFFPKGTTTVTCTTTTGPSCSFTVTVNDTQPPALTCPSNITTTTSSPCSVVAYTTPAAGDNCSVTVTCTPPSGTCFSVGATTVTCTASDGANTSSCTFTVTVNQTQPCTLTCPANLTRPNDPGQCGAVVTYSAPTTSGMCSAVTCTPPSGSFFAKGTTTVTCASNGGPSCSFTVKINDTQPPAISCPANLTKPVGSGCNAVVTYAPTVGDNCPGMTASCSPPSGSTFAVGTTTVTCTATDASGNTASCSFTVTVVNNPPTARAGPDQTVDEGVAVMLDGSASSDPNAGQSLTFQWSQLNGPSVALSGANTAKPSFAAPPVAELQCLALTFQLKVTDSCGAVAADTVVVTVADRFVLQDDRNGHCVVVRRTCAGNAATYCWRKPDGSTASGPCTVSVQGSTVNVQSTPADPNLFQGLADVGRHTGNARLTETRANPTRTSAIADSNILNSTCNCQ
jgi:CSLREA domain-containing protein